MKNQGVIAVALCVPAMLVAQKPVINPGGAVNAAGLVPVSQPGHGLAPGSIASLFGQNLASTTASAPGLPLPTTLAGTSVNVNGAKVPLFYVSPDQINFQVPSDAPWSYTAYGQISITVTTKAGTSEPIVADGVMRDLMIFTTNGNGCGAGSILNVAADGRTSPNSHSNSASPGDYIEIYGTGLGAVYHPPPDGSPALSNPLSDGEYGAGLTFNLEESVSTSFDGRAPGLVGVDQLNVMVPGDVRQGCAVPLSFVSGGPPVTLSIHSGGGQCVDPPIQSTGTFTLEKSVVLNDSSIPEADSFTGSFSASPGNALPTPPTLPLGYTTTTQATPACPIPGYSTPDAGVITISGPGLPATNVAPAIVNGLTAYDGSLPSGTVGAGTYQISAADGHKIGKFQVAVTVGPDIQVTSQFPQGQIRGTGPLVVNWTGGAAGEAVTVTVVQHEFGFDQLSVIQVPATTGTASFDPSVYSFLNGISTEIDVQVGPDPTHPQVFSAPGLTLGGQVSWAIVHRFVGLTF